MPEIEMPSLHYQIGEVVNVKGADGTERQCEVAEIRISLVEGPAFVRYFLKNPDDHSIGIDPDAENVIYGFVFPEDRKDMRPTMFIRKEA